MLQKIQQLILPLRAGHHQQLILLKRQGPVRRCRRRRDRRDSGDHTAGAMGMALLQGQQHVAARGEQ